MKRTIALALALLLLALAGCGGAQTDAQADAPTASAPEAASAAAENEACRVTIALREQTDAAVTFGLTMENRTDAQLTVIADLVGFNGVLLFSETFTAMELVDAGASAETTVAVDLATLGEYGISDVASADCSVVAIDDAGTTVLEDTQRCVLRADAAPETPAAPEREQVLLEQDGVRLSIGGGHTDAYGDYAVLLRCENAADGDVQVSMEQFAYNGHEADEYSLFIVPAGGAGYAKVRISADVLALMGLTVDDLTELSFSLRAERLEPQTVLAEQSVTYALQ